MVTPLVFDHYPVSHSLIAVLGWAGLVGGIHYFLKRNRIAALALGLLVVSHWALDAIVHQPDQPPSTEAIAWAGHAQWLLVLRGYWIDPHRRVAARG